MQEYQPKGVEKSLTIPVDLEKEVPYNNLMIGKKNSLAVYSEDWRHSGKMPDGDITQFLVSSVPVPAIESHGWDRVFPLKERMLERYRAEHKLIAKPNSASSAFMNSRTSVKGVTHYASVTLQFDGMEIVDKNFLPTLSNGSWNRNSAHQNSLRAASSPAGNEAALTPNKFSILDAPHDAVMRSSSKSSGDMLLIGKSPLTSFGRPKVAAALVAYGGGKENSPPNYQQNEGAWVKIGKMDSHVASMRLQFSEEYASSIGETAGFLRDQRAERLREVLKTLPSYADESERKAVTAIAEENVPAAMDSIASSGNQYNSNFLKEDMHITAVDENDIEIGKKGQVRSNNVDEGKKISASDQIGIMNVDFSTEESVPDLTLILLEGQLEVEVEVDDVNALEDEVTSFLTSLYSTEMHVLQSADEIFVKDSYEPESESAIALAKVTEDVQLISSSSAVQSMMLPYCSVSSPYFSPSNSAEGSTEVSLFERVRGKTSSSIVESLVLVPHRTPNNAFDKDHVLSNKFGAVGEHTTLLIILISTTCVLGYLFFVVLRRSRAIISIWRERRVRMHISGMESQAVHFMMQGEYSKAVDVLSSGVKYIVSIDGEELKVNSAGFKHLLGKALIASGEFSAAESLIRSVAAYYEEIELDDLHLARVLEDLAMALQSQGDGRQDEAYGYLTRALKIYEREMMMSVLDLGGEGEAFYGVAYHAQVYSARLMGDAIASADVGAVAEASAVVVHSVQCAFFPHASDDVERSECKRAVAELEALLAAPRAVEVEEQKIPHTAASIARRIDVARVRYEMGLLFELSEQFEDALLVIEESLDVFTELEADCCGLAHFAVEAEHIGVFTALLQKKVMELEGYFKDDALCSSEIEEIVQSAHSTPKKDQKEISNDRGSPDTVAF